MTPDLDRLEAELRDADYTGACQHLRSWCELDRIHGECIALITDLRAARLAALKQPAVTDEESEGRIRRYIFMRDAKPLSQSDDRIHGMHCGSEWEAELRLSDLRNVMAALTALQVRASSAKTPDDSVSGGQRVEAPALDEAVYTEGVCGDGAAILCDGVPVSITHVLDRLNSTPALIAQARRAGAKEEKARIIAGLEHEASVLPCAEDAAVAKSMGTLVRADFSYDGSDRLDALPLEPQS